MDRKNVIGKNIKLLRNEKGLTQKLLSELTNISYKSIINYENGLREPKTDTIKVLSNFFEVSEAFIRGETNIRKPLYDWEDKEVMDEVKASFFSLTNKLVKTTEKQSDRNQKIIFNILLELEQVLKLNNEDTKEKILDLVEQNLITYESLANRLDQQSLSKK